jgi:chromosome segregation ATPase
MEEKRSNSMSIILGVLLGLAAIAAIYFGIKHNQDVKEAAMKQAEIDSLVAVRTNLETELNSLNLRYSAIAMENDSLKGSMESAREAIAKKDEQIRWAQRKSANDAKALKEEIAMLQSSKEEMANTIDRLNKENDQLKMTNAELTEKLTVSEEQNTALKGQVGDLERANTLLEQRTAQLANSAYKASAMQVNIARKNDKTTIKAGRVRKFTVSFDLVEVPEEFRGEQTIYLTITDANGIPIAEGGQKVRVGSENQALVIEALESKKVNIGLSQRLEFTHSLSDKVKKGFYIFSVYADKGLIGSTMYQLI